MRCAAFFVLCCLRASLSAPAHALRGDPKAALTRSIATRERVLRIGDCSSAVDAHITLLGAVAAAREHGISRVTLPAFAWASGGYDEFGAVFDDAIFGDALAIAGVAVTSGDAAAAFGPAHALGDTGDADAWAAFDASGADAVDIACSHSARAPARGDGAPASVRLTPSQGPAVIVTPDVVERHAKALALVLAALVPAPALAAHVDAVRAVLRGAAAVAVKPPSAVGGEALAGGSSLPALTAHPYDAVSLPGAAAPTRGPKHSSPEHTAHAIEAAGVGRMGVPLFIATDDAPPDPALLAALRARFPDAVMRDDGGGAPAALPPHLGALVDAHVSLGALRWVGDSRSPWAGVVSLTRRSAEARLKADTGADADVIRAAAVNAPPLLTPSFHGAASPMAPTLWSDRAHARTVALDATLPIIINPTPPVGPRMLPSQANTQVSFASTGTFIVPPNVYSIHVSLWGGGGGPQGQGVRNKLFEENIGP